MPTITQAFGHGLSMDTPPPVNHQGRDVTITAEMLPAFYDDKGMDKQIKIRFEKKIAGTSASTQFAIVVAPEFGPLAILILILTMSFIIILRSYPKILLK